MSESNSHGNSHAEPPGCCPSSETKAASTELKLYQAFIFSGPILFTFILLLLFYFFYLRRQRVDWSSLTMRASAASDIDASMDPELGLKKELREMVPIVIYKESFTVKDSQCSVCLLDYKAEDRLQQIPTCGHTFHVNCIDLWLANHTTCPLCRLSLAPKHSSAEQASVLLNMTTHEEMPTRESPELRSLGEPTVPPNC